MWLTYACVLLSLGLSVSPNPSLEEPIMYDSLCDYSSPETAPTTVLFNKVDKARPCVCFSHGLYEVQEADCSTGSVSPSPTLVSVEEEGSCVLLHPETKSIKRVFIPTSVQEPIPISGKYPACGGDTTNVLRRRKRGATTPTLGPANITDPMDEDFLSSGKEVGHELMRNQMDKYIEGVIAKLNGLHNDGGDATDGAKNKYPVIKLLDYTKRIMQRTCGAVSADFFDLALNSFISLQLESFHIKEPYIGYAAFKRIEQAMQRCLKNAAPQVFIRNATDNSTQPEECEIQVTEDTYNSTIVDPGTPSQHNMNITIPAYGSSLLNASALAEPLIETVWKMLVSTHSYCFMYFSDYFNDHHTYTVSLLPMFTNQIQEIWLRGYQGNSTSETKLYGGLLGDVTKIMMDVDMCVGAARATTPYPWFMNRPPLDKSNVWRRKKREVVGEWEDSLEDDWEVVSLNQIKAEGMVDFSCKSSTLHPDDLCGPAPPVKVTTTFSRQTTLG